MTLKEALQDCITGEKFIKLADCIYCPNPKDDYGYIFYNETIPADSKIIYTNTNFILQLFAKLEQMDFANESLVIVSHNSDYNVNEMKIPDCVRKWFSTNVNFYHEKLQSIPIGLENECWFPEIHKKEKMLKKLDEPKNIKNLLYVNHRIETNPKERQEPYNLFKDKDWATIVYGRNGENFDEYLDNIYNHNFVLCPDGNGIDTHRIWEVLYMGSIPVAKEGINIEFFAELPIVRTKKWSWIDDRLQIFCPIDNEKYDMLSFTYWKNFILSA